MAAWNKKIRALIIVSLALVLFGCKETALHHGVSEQEANEMVALMQRAGIPASKSLGKEDTFTVSTSAETFADAVQLLTANGLPKQQFETLGSVFDEQSFVTSRVAQHARYIHALSEEIAHTLSSIDGVILARVHLSVPEKDPLADAAPKSSASVMVKHRDDVDISQYIGQIKALVVNGLQNLKYDDVTVFLVEAQPQQDMMNKQPLIVQGNSDFRMGSVTQMGSGLLVPAVLAVLASIGGFGLYWKQRKATAVVHANTEVEQR
ncbi:MAG: type III secretion inner membrane ring lipoprotein SctJ [Granulosicoccaceae bacterium]